MLHFSLEQGLSLFPGLGTTCEVQDPQCHELFLSMNDQKNFESRFEGKADLGTKPFTLGTLDRNLVIWGVIFMPNAHVTIHAHDLIVAGGVVAAEITILTGGRCAVYTGDTPHQHRQLDAEIRINLYAHWLLFRQNEIRLCGFLGTTKGDLNIRANKDLGIAGSVYSKKNATILGDKNISVSAVMVKRENNTT